jgi:histone acetyltransferase 1
MIPASEAISINLTRNDKNLFEPFPPTHTYAIFGEDEIIPGYKNLQINLTFRANDLQPSVKITHHSKLPSVNDEMKSLMDLEGRLGKFLPESVFAGDTEDNNGSKEIWKPPGKLLHGYMSGKKNFEIWQSKLSDARAKQIVSNMRIFIPFFIDGGTVDFLDEPEWALERWNIFFL